ncbi:unnamed protein product [Gordionus sp. m RMFG-2023]
MEILTNFETPFTGFIYTKSIDYTPAMTDFFIEPTNSMNDIITNNSINGLLSYSNLINSGNAKVITRNAINYLNDNKNYVHDNCIRRVTSQNHVSFRIQYFACKIFPSIDTYTNRSIRHVDLIFSKVNPENIDLNMVEYPLDCYYDSLNLPDKIFAVKPFTTIKILLTFPTITRYQTTKIGVRTTETLPAKNDYNKNDRILQQKIQLFLESLLPSFQKTLKSKLNTEILNNINIIKNVQTIRKPSEYVNLSRPNSKIKEFTEKIGNYYPPTNFKVSKATKNYYMPAEESTTWPTKIKTYHSKLSKGKAVYIKYPPKLHIYRLTKIDSPPAKITKPMIKTYTNSEWVLSTTLPYYYIPYNHNVSSYLPHSYTLGTKKMVSDMYKEFLFKTYKKLNRTFSYVTLNSNYLPYNLYTHQQFTTTPYYYRRPEKSTIKLYTYPHYSLFFDKLKSNTIPSKSKSLKTLPFKFISYTLPSYNHSFIRTATPFSTSTNSVGIINLSNFNSTNSSTFNIPPSFKSFNIIPGNLNAGTTAKGMGIIGYCGNDSMVITGRNTHGFYGTIFTPGYYNSENCKFRGTGQIDFELKISLKNCGIEKSGDVFYRTLLIIIYEKINGVIGTGNTAINVQCEIARVINHDLNKVGKYERYPSHHHDYPSKGIIKTDPPMNMLRVPPGPMTLPPVPQSLIVPPPAATQIQRNSISNSFSFANMLFPQINGDPFQQQSNMANLFPNLNNINNNNWPNNGFLPPASQAILHSRRKHGNHRKYRSSYTEFPDGDSFFDADFSHENYRARKKLKKKRRRGHATTDMSPHYFINNAKNRKYFMENNIPMYENDNGFKEMRIGNLENEYPNNLQEGRLNFDPQYYGTINGRYGDHPKVDESNFFIASKNYDVPSYNPLQVYDHYNMNPTRNTRGTLDFFSDDESNLHVRFYDVKDIQKMILYDCYLITNSSKLLIDLFDIQGCPVYHPPYNDIIKGFGIEDYDIKFECRVRKILNKIKRC